MKRSTTLLLAAIVAVAAAPAYAVDVVVQASSTWGKKHDNAVSRIGGEIVWKHVESGTGVVRGSGDDFYAKLVKTKAFKYSARDVTINWQPGLKVSESRIDDGFVGDGVVANGGAIFPDDDARYPAQWAHPAIDTSGAWDGGCTGAGARVAILDGGLYDLHQDLDAQIDAACSVSFVGGQPYNNDTGTFWHGTHVASIVAGEDNLISGVGIAPEADIIGVKVLHSGSGSFSAILSGILYASDPAGFGADPGCKADIINMSLGVPGGVLRREAASRGEGANFLAIITNIMNYAARQNVLVVSSAGNEAIDFGQETNSVVVPGQLGNGVAISATAPVGWGTGATDYDTPASYSNFGEDLIWVSAPGGDANCYTAACDETCNIAGTSNPCWVYDLYIAACRGSGGSTTSSCWAAGTSMAAPVVSGVAALMKGANPALTRADLKELLKDSAWDSGAPGHDEFHGHGWVNASAACSAAMAFVPPVE
jgi:lantibiotic leader peptide-processing serine protease